MKKVEVSYGFWLSQFSFSVYDDKKYGEYKEYPVIDGRLVTPVNFIVEMTMYDFQLNLIASALEKEMNSLDINFKLSVELVYNNYGNLFIVWTTSKKNFDKCIEISDNLNDNEFVSDDIEMISLYFFDFENWMENEYESDLENIELYVERCKFLGYAGNLDDHNYISGCTGLDINFVDEYMNNLVCS